MANESIKQDIILNIKENNNNEITGEILQSVLLAMVDALGEGAQFMGEAVQTTVPATGDSNMFYLAVHAGTYPSFNVTTEHPSLLTNQGGTWHALALTDLPIWNGAEAGSIIVGSRTNSATDEQAYAEGYDTSASAPQAHAEGNGSNATGDVSHAEGNGTAAQGTAAHSEGDATTAIGDYSHAEGNGTTASGQAAHAEGQGTQALKKGAHAEGQGTTANGGGAHAEGVGSEAAAKGAHAEGTNTEARAEDAHAEGYATVAAGGVSHAEGSNSSANGAVSHAEGYDAAAGGDYSHAEGEGTRTTNEAEHAEGAFNKSNTGTRHSVGIGTSNADRKNAVEVMDNGDVYINGVGGYDGTNAGESGVTTLQEGMAHTYGFIFDVTKENSGTTFASLSALLSSPNLSTLIPTSVRTGGMTIRFVLSSDNNYVQYRLMPDEFTTDVTQWQGVDAEPIAGSKNLAESGGIGNILSVTPETTEVHAYVKNDVWVNSQYALYCFYAVKTGDVIRIKAQDSKPAICSLTSDTSHEDGETPSYINESYIGIRIEAGDVGTLVVPQDCYLLVQGKASASESTNYTPIFVLKNNGRLPQIENDINELNLELSDQKSSIELVAKKKTFVLTWAVGGCLVSGSINDNAQYKHAFVNVVKGDVLKVSCPLNLPGSYAPVAYYDGTKYIPKFTFVGDWNEFVFIADKTEQVVITARDSAGVQTTVKSVSSEVSGSLEASIIKDAKNLSDYKEDISLVSKVKTLNPSWTDGAVYMDGTLYSSSNYKHTTVNATKGDVIKVSFNSSLAPGFVPVSFYDGTKYVKKTEDITTFITEYTYIADKTESITLSARGTIITVKVVNSEAIGEEKSEIQKGFTNTANYTHYMTSPNKAYNIDVIWERGQINNDGGYGDNENRVRTASYIDIRNLVLLRVESDKRFFICLYDKDKTFLSRTEYASGTKAAVVLNTTLWRLHEYKIGFAKIWIDGTDYSNTIISGDTVQSAFNNRRLLSSNTVKCACHQGITMHVQPDGLERNNGGNFLSSFWGSYLCGFDMNLVNHLFTSDGVPVCSHDNEVTDDNGVTFRISEVTLAQLNTHTFGGETIPTLDSVMYLSKMLGMEVFLVNVNVLSGESDRLWAVLDIISKYRMWEYTWLMCSGDTLDAVLTANSKARIAICQTNVSSTSLEDIEAAVAAATAVITNDNEVMIWANGAQSAENLETVSTSMDGRIKLGCYNIGGNSATIESYNTALVTRLPYLNVYSSHYESYGCSLRNIELGVAAKYPTIIAWQNGNII